MVKHRQGSKNGANLPVLRHLSLSFLPPWEGSSLSRTLGAFILNVDVATMQTNRQTNRQKKSKTMENLSNLFLLILDKLFRGNETATASVLCHAILWRAFGS